MKKPLLRVENVSFQYPEAEWRLDDVSFELHEGELLAIIGPNGSGKSTLLRLATGILSPSAGRVMLEDNVMTAIDRRRVARILGYLPQQAQYAFDYSVEEVVGMGRFAHLTGMGFLTANDQKVVLRSMEQTETLQYRARRLSRLSGGERQRAFLASVLAQEPRVLLLDEPTAALDIHHQARFFHLLQALAARGIGVAVVTHDLNLASFYCDRLLLMSRGRKRAEGGAEEILREPILREAYGEAIRVTRDAETDRPVVLPEAAPAKGEGR